MLDRVYRFAHFLHSLGIANGERVAVLAKNESALLEAHFAVPFAGGILCALNTRLVAAEISYIVEHCGASVILYDAEFAPLLSGVGPGVRRVCIGHPNDGGALDFEESLASASSEPVPNPVTDEDATISINYTSGTTGQPKGVMYTHRGAAVNALSEIYHANLRPDSAYLWTLPMFHCNGWCFPWAVTAAGSTHVCLPKVDPKIVLDLIEREHVTHMCGAPTILISLANVPGVTPFRHPISITTAGAPPAPTTIAQMEDLGATITHVYGLTETYGPISAPARARLKARQGVPMITVGAHEIRVVDPDLNDVPCDGTTQGEIVMRGNNVMKGYYNDPEGTAKAFSGGWFHSGDIGAMHPDGYIEILDRSKDVIISGGENISTQQVEKAILTHPAVMECAVIAIPDPKWGEVPKAYIVMKPGSTVSAEEIIAHCRTLLPGFKTPKQVAFEDLPKTSTGKIQKYLLREREWAGKDKRVN
jgi:fatty-acyl-CoA synthase